MATKKKKETSGVPKIKYPGDIGYDPVSGVDISVPDTELTDLSYTYDPVTSQDITAKDVTAGTVTADDLAERSMNAADYTLIDPSKIASEYGDINREEMRKNADLSSELALKTLDTELQGLQSYAPAAANLQRQEVAKDNQFNQQQRDAQLDAVDPNIRADLMAQRENANALASGRLPSSIDDRALELGIRSAAADAAAGGGFGVSSSAARKASDLLSAQQRLGILMQGEQLRSANIDQRNSTLMANLQQATGGSQISVNPSQTAGQMALAIASEANAGNITADKALANLTQQEQFKTNLQQEANVTNVKLAADRDLNQAKLNLDAQTTNVGHQLQADMANQSANLQAQTTNVSNQMRAQEINASNAIQVQTQQKQLASQERQFNATMSYNVQNANAQRQFDAANANAGRALEVATSNRATKVQIDTTNKQMVFQDRQARAAEAAANARAAMSARASMANAQLSYKSNQESIAANMQLAREQMDMQLRQQQMSTDATKQGIDAMNRNNDIKTGAEIISRAPAIIDTGSKLWDMIKGMGGDSKTVSNDPGFTVNTSDYSGDTSARADSVFY